MSDFTTMTTSDTTPALPATDGQQSPLEDDSDESWRARLEQEFAAARKEVEQWHVRGKNVIKRFRDERTDAVDGDQRWNLFTANIQTQRALLYGNTPSVDVTRKFADANDDIARCAAEMMERLLNCDISRDSDGYRDGLDYALLDLLMPGMGQCRLRYVVEFEKVTNEAIPHPETGEELEPAEEVERKKPGSEDVEVIYVQWNDVLWSSGARTPSEARMWAFRSQMTREDLVQRFRKKGEQVPLNSKKPMDRGQDSVRTSSWDRADVWEVWYKEKRTVVWYVEGYGLLDKKPDPLGLDGFWPFPKPMIANRTNTTLVPVPDFYLAQDLYNEVDEVTARISLIVKAVRVVGVYDKTATDSVQRLVNETRINELIPVDNWAMFAEKGGVKGQVDWLPLDMVVAALDKLRDYRQEIVAALYQITGFSDIMRGEASTGGVTATEQGIKARFASVRLQALQDEFARFASDIQKIKAEIIAKHFDDETIIQRSNIQYTDDAPLAQQAVQLLRDRFSHYRIEVKPDSVSMTDFAQLKAERTEFMQGLSGFFTAMAPIGQAMPGATPYLLEMCKWFVAGMRGSTTIEATLDRAIEDAKKTLQQQAMNPQPQQMDPKLQAAQLKAQSDQMRAAADMQKEQMKVKGDLIRISAETQAKDQQEKSQAMWNTWEAAKKHSIQKAAGGTATPGVMGGNLS